MPHLFVTGYGNVELRRVLLDIREVAGVLNVEVREVRNMLRHDELTNASADYRRRVAPTELLDVIERGVAADTLSPLCRVRLARLVATAPRAGGRAS